MQERTSTTERYTRGVAAALVAVATLILAANAGPARASVLHAQDDLSFLTVGQQVDGDTGSSKACSTLAPS